jgi:hypothetical protein
MGSLRYEHARNLSCGLVGREADGMDVKCSKAFQRNYEVRDFLGGFSIAFLIDQHNTTRQSSMIPPGILKCRSLSYFNRL